MLSRTASELFWMARYLERAESYARVLDVTWKLSMIQSFTSVYPAYAVIKYSTKEATFEIPVYCEIRLM